MAAFSLAPEARLQVRTLVRRSPRRRAEKGRSMAASALPLPRFGGAANPRGDTMKSPAQPGGCFVWWHLKRSFRFDVERGLSLRSAPVWATYAGVTGRIHLIGP